MVLVDTSVWVKHLRDGEPVLEDLLKGGHVVCHLFIVGELACGNLKNRTEILGLLQTLPMAVLAEDGEVLRFIENNRLMGRGLGLIDMHLLASALLSGLQLWTLDKRLQQAALKLGVAF
ncbi:MAG: type II toxin-antitoxin system VapC family toxin [Desulfobacteraceae bacterium]|jgi:predicted nucleic acid-binding protein|nr:MAG: type II toxin-antitoxin system VapC family toxin [Desulfobacteraceae bacterium]